MNRRRFLTLMGTSGLLTFAGCSYGGNQPGHSTQESPSEETIGKASGSNPSAPEITVSSAATESAGEVVIRVDGEDEEGLQQVVVYLNGGKVRRQTLSGERSKVYEATLTSGDTDAIRPGELNRVRGVISDVTGNSADDEVAQYVRRYDKIPESELTITAGGIFVPWVGERREQQIPEDSGPSGGFPQSIESWKIALLIDQMEGYGIQPLCFNFTGIERAENLYEKFEQVDLADSISIECYYDLPKAFEWQEGEMEIEKIRDDMHYIRDTFFTQPNYNTYDGRPVLPMWDAVWFMWGGSEEAAKVQDRVEDFGGPEAFVNMMRSEAAVDGVEPYLIGDFHDNAPDYPKLTKHFDAATTWITYRPEENTVYAWDDILARTEETFASTREFVLNHDLEFAPGVFPGFDDRAASWGQGHVIPRRPDRFADLLQLADEYRTDNLDRVYLNTINDWSEGTAMQPGTWRGEEFGTDFYDLVRQYVTSGKV